VVVCVSECVIEVQLNPKCPHNQGLVRWLCVCVSEVQLNPKCPHNQGLVRWLCVFECV